MVKDVTTAPMAAWIGAVAGQFQLEPMRAHDEDQVGPDPAAADEDAALMGRVQAGDMAAFGRLVENHQARVIGTVAKMLGSPSDAEDVAQQVFIRVWKSAARYHPSARFTTWLFTITRNLVFNEIRRRKRHPSTPLEPGADSQTHQYEDPSVTSPDNALLEAELQREIAAAIDALPETQRMAVVLRRYEEMPYEEIAAVLDLTVPAVKSLLFRARAELRIRLGKYLRPGE